MALVFDSVCVYVPSDDHLVLELALWVGYMLVLRYCLVCSTFAQYYRIQRYVIKVYELTYWHSSIYTNNV